MRTLKNVALITIALGLFLGIRYIGSTIRYGCANPVPLVNVEGGDDCPPPFYLLGRLGWLLTGGSLNPLWNHDTTTVEKIGWNIEKSDATSEEQQIFADVTLMDGTTKRYDLGTARGCTGDTKNEIWDHKRYFGRVDCYFTLSGTKFAAFSQNKEFRIERYDESAKDGSIATTTLVEIK